MEVIVIVIILWALSCMFPGSGQSYFHPLQALGTLVSALLILAAMTAWWTAGVWAILWVGDRMGIEPGTDGAVFVLLFALIGPIAVPMIVAGIMSWFLQWRLAVRRRITIEVER